MVGLLFRHIKISKSIFYKYAINGAGGLVSSSLLTTAIIENGVYWALTLIAPPLGALIVSSLYGIAVGWNHPRFILSMDSPTISNYFMPNQVMCVGRLASIACERSDPRFKPALWTNQLLQQL